MSYCSVRFSPNYQWMRLVTGILGQSRCRLKFNSWDSYVSKETTNIYLISTLSLSFRSVDCFHFHFILIGHTKVKDTIIWHYVATIRPIKWVTVGNSAGNIFNHNLFKLDYRIQHKMYFLKSY